MRKPAPARAVPPPLELLCLKALWSLREGNVKAVQQSVTSSKPLAYTTVMTLLERLMRKGIVSRRKTGRAFVYVPEVSRDSMRRRALQEFLDCYFEGSEEQLLGFLGTPPPVAPAAPPPVERYVEARLDAALL